MCVKKLKKLLDSNKTLRIIIDFVAVIIIWRGVWGFMDLYFFPNSELISSIGSIILGFIFIISDGKGIKELIP